MGCRCRSSTTHRKPFSAPSLHSTLSVSATTTWSIVIAVTALAQVLSVNSLALSSTSQVYRRQKDMRPGAPAAAAPAPGPSFSSGSSSSSASSLAAAGGGERIVRYYRLLGRCSESHVRMTSSHVDSLAHGATDPYGQFRAVSESFDSQLRLQSVLSRTFLCFSQTGKLIVKHSGSSRNCLLRERLSTDGGFVEFQSVVNASWLIGFNNRGQRLAGDHWRVKPRSRRCFQFTKTSFNYLSPIEPRRTTRHRKVRHPSPSSAKHAAEAAEAREHKRSRSRTASG